MSKESRFAPLRALLSELVKAGDTPTLVRRELDALVVDKASEALALVESMDVEPVAPEPPPADPNYVYRG